MTKRRAVIYVRQSQDKTGEGAAVDRQEADCRRLAEYRDWEVVEVIPENDVSASGKVKRPGFDRLIKHLTDGTADAVIAERLDRLTRNARDTLRLLEAGEAAKAHLAFPQGSDMNLGTADGLTMASVLAAFAQGEINKKGERQRAANSRRAQSGQASWVNRPFGYQRVKEGSTWTVTTVPAEAQAIQQAARNVIELRYTTLAAEVRKINAAGLLTTDGKPFNVTTLRRILLGARYSGRMIYQGVDVGPGDWPPILDHELQQRVSEKLRNPKRRVQIGNELKYMMSGTAICGKPDCGEVMFASINQGAMVYRCITGHMSRSQAKVDAIVNMAVVERLSRPDAASLFAPDVDLDALRAGADELRLRRDGIGDLIAEGLLSPIKGREQLLRVNELLTDVEAQIGAASGTSPVAALALCGDVAASWEGMSLRARREVVDLLMTVTILPAGKGNHWTNLEQWAEHLRIDWRKA